MERGQAHTLEAITAALLLLASVVFALQVTAVTPLTASTSSQHIENQQQAVARGVLAAADQNDTLKRTLLYWDEEEGTFHGASFQDAYPLGGPPTQFGHTLNETFNAEGIAFNVNLYYVTGSGKQQQRNLVYRGAPSDHAVSARRTVTLYDDDPLYDEDNTRRSRTLDEASSYFASADISPGTDMYNVVVVEVVAWRM